jgi:hypothetical protein
MTRIEGKTDGNAVNVWPLYDIYGGKLFVRVHPNSERYVPHDLVRFITQFQIEPAKFPVVTTDDKVITRRVNIHGRYPFYTRHEGFNQFLLCKVI